MADGVVEADEGLGTKEGALALLEHWKRHCAAEMEATGQLDDNPRAILICRRLPSAPSDRPIEKTDTKPLPYAVARPLYIPDAMKPLIPPQLRSKMFAQLCRGMSEALDAVGILVMMDMWFATTTERPLPGQQVKDRLDKKEGLMLSLEHQAVGRLCYIAQILRNPDRLAEWREMPKHGLEGRYLNIIPGLPGSN